MIPKSKTQIMITLIRQYVGHSFQRILIVGCGSGQEAVELADAFKAKVVGIDLNPSFCPLPAEKVELRIGDATRLEFPDAYFDLIYSFHVLEHIPQYTKALSEMARVSTKGGGILIGTPNRARWIGYLGSQTASWPQKVFWNWKDWQARFRGRFRNEFGAHAGFLSAELKQELEKAFADVTEITLPYYLEQYSQRRHLIQGLANSGVGRFLFPAIYFIGKKKLASEVIPVL